MEPHSQRQFVLALAHGEGPTAAIDTMAKAIVGMAGASIPDVGSAREALETWGIPFEQGEPIHQMFSSTPAFNAKLPAGWSVSPRGGGHVALLDARGASRLRWHIHGWDPIFLAVNARFFRKYEEVSVSEGVVQVIDGVTVIHTFPVHHPHLRINDPIDGHPHFKNGWVEDGWSREMGATNYKAKEDADEAARAWLRENRPGYDDAIKSWGL